MVQYNDCGHDDPEFFQRGEPEFNYQNYANRHGDFGKHAPNQVGGLSGQCNLDYFTASNSLPVAQVGQIGHNYATFDERVFAKRSRESDSLWGEADFNYEPTNFQLAQELQLDSSEGLGLVSDGTISSGISTGSSVYDIQPGGYDIPESASSTESCYAAETTLGDAVFFGGSLVEFGKSSLVSLESTQLKPRPVRRCNEPESIQDVANACTPSRPTRVRAIPRQSTAVLDPKPRHYCTQGEPCSFYPGGFTRDQDRRRHERTRHSTVDGTSDNVPCQECGIQRRIDNHGEHWRKWCWENPNRTG